MSHKLNFLKFVFCFLASFGLLSQSQADILIDGYTPATNDRFTNSPSFIANGFNLSGVGQASDGKWATAISRNVVISANHFAPSGAITFHVDNNSGGGTVVRNIVPGSGTLIAGTDLWLGVLDSSLPGSIVHYNYATEPLSGLVGAFSSAGIYHGLNAYMFGRSPASHPGTRDQAVGRNRISNYIENVAFTGSDNDSLVMIYESSGNPEYVTYESFFQGGDSGGPMFVDIAGEFRLLGTNAFISYLDPPTNSIPGLSGINYTGNQTTAINTFIANAVPEPGSLTLLASASLVLLARRRRSA